MEVILQFTNIEWISSKKQKYTYKINISFEFILLREDIDAEKRTTVQLKLFKASTNTRIFDHPTAIDSKTDVEHLYNKLLKEDPREKLTNKRPDSK